MVCELDEVKVSPVGCRRWIRRPPADTAWSQNSGREPARTTVGPIHPELRPRRHYLPSMIHPVLLHGFTGRAASWGDALLDDLASRVGPPVLVDLPGHGSRVGETDPEDFTLERAWELIDEALPEPAPLLGYSMGGRLALSYAVEHPERVSALVLESASPGLLTAEERAQRRTADEELARRLEQDGIEAFVDTWEGLPLFSSRKALPDEVWARERALRLANDPHSLASSLRGLGTGALPSYWEALGELGLPVLLVVGALDVKFRAIAGHMADRLPRARQVVVPEAGHTVHLERPGAWVDAVGRFLDGVV